MTLTGGLGQEHAEVETGCLAKPVGHGIWELRLMFGPGYRVYYLHDGQRAILLLCGGDKATQPRDIERAYQLADDHRNEEGQGHG
ncbi:MAG: type II toxin-antitoxin system RelE/ParE family toxin [Micrococcales bacterium]|nr:type II toxin-antitoxin system RelE/ParE family toxin [Micrococcales bacterium]